MGASSSNGGHSGTIFLTLKRNSNFIGKKNVPEWPPLLLLLVSQCTRVVGSNSGSDSYFRRDQWQAGQLQVIASMKHIESVKFAIETGCTCEDP